jgi:Protein of unknown function (DUF2637)
MSLVQQSQVGAEHDRRPELDVWVRRISALVVAGVAAYASYQHQRAFAAQGGADATSAGLWPLSVDGLLLLATAGLIAAGAHPRGRVRLAAWVAFGLGIGVSLAANIASAPTLAWQPVLVAGWPPVALLLAVELLAHGRPRLSNLDTETTGETESESVGHLGRPRDETESRLARTAEDVMWEHFQREVSRGRMPTGAELDRVAGTNNFGRAVLRRWRQAGRVPPATVVRLGNGPESETPSDDASEETGS